MIPRDRPNSLYAPRAALLHCAVLGALAGMGQTNGEGWRLRRIVLDSSLVRIDTLSIAPGSFTLLLGDSLIDAEAFHLDPWKGTLTWSGGDRPVDTLTARYRVLPMLLAGPYRHKDPDRLITRASDRPDPFRYTPPRSDTDLLGISGLNKSGSISRGILFGNNQDLSVNSTLNLELSGHLTDRINVLASITDNNIPIQADGNTLELQDFDQVFIKLFGEPDPATGAGWELIAGDFVLQRPKAHFLTYLKKTKGLGFGLRTGDAVKQELGVSAAISKGRFARNIIQGIEGVQGPYRLRGDLGESYIIVLSGTERVYIDGQLMARGQDNDYVIDYNTAEVTFTTNRLITKDRRISVEFQYSDRNYARSLVQAGEEVRWGGTSLRLNVFSEQDHRNQPSQQALTDEEKVALSEAGDDPQAAVVPGYDSVAYSLSEVLYARIDSLGYDPVFLYTTNADSAYFRVSFTQVGNGNGDYVQESFTPNGRVFLWVAPDTVAGNIVHRGDYAPVRVLVAPKTKRMVTLGVDHRFGERTSITTELALSNSDENTFSSIDDGDNTGVAAQAGVTHSIALGTDSVWSLILGGDVEMLTQEFRPVERYRPVEFERDWNALTTALDNDQLLTGVRVGVDGGQRGRASLHASTFQVRERYGGWKQGLDLDLHPGRWDIVGSGSLLRTTDPFTSDFLRNKLLLARRMKGITLGVKDEQELNRFRTDTSDALSPGSYGFLDWEAFLQSPDTFRNKWRVAGGMREDQALRSGSLATSTRATHYSASLDLARNPRRRLATTFIYRQLVVLDTNLTAQKPEDSYLTRIDHDLVALKGVITLDLLYEFSSGLEPRKEFIYVEVPAGQGLYIWIDYNGDGIKQLNEFELANFSYEADHIRVNVPTNDYVRAFGNVFNASLDLRPSATWTSETGFKGFVARLSDFAAFRADRKTSTDDLAAALDPFRIDVSDTALTAFSSSARNTIYFDRSSRTWSIDHTYQNDRGRSLLLNGFESRVRESNKLHLRWNTTPKWTLEVEGETGRTASNSDLIEGRTYSIDQNSAQPSLTFQPGTTFRTSLRFKHSNKVNDETLGGEQAEINDLSAEMRWNAPGKGSIQATMSVVKITYDGDVNTSLGNEMLGGLKPGDNLTWSLGIQRNLNDHLQIDITYNGRKSDGTPAVHVGGGQVRAFF